MRKLCHIARSDQERLLKSNFNFGSSIAAVAIGGSKDGGWFVAVAINSKVEKQVD